MKKLTKAIALCLVALLGLAACSSSGSSTAPPAESTGSVSEAAPEEQANEDATTIKWFTSKNATDEVLVTVQLLVDQYNAEGHNIDFVVETSPDRPSYDQKLRTMIAGGQMPDIFDMDPTPYCQELADAGKLVDMEAFLTEIGEYDKFVPLSIDYLRLPDERLFIIPMELSVEMIWYNTDIFNEYGLSAPATFDEWLDVCAVLQQNDITPLAMDGVDGWPLIRYLAEKPFRRSGNEFLTQLSTGEAKMSDEIGIESLEFIADIGQYFQTGFSSTDYSTALNLFLSGKAAMFEIGTWELNQFVDGNRPEGLNVDYFYLPTMEGAVTQPNESWVFGGIGLACNPDTFDGATKDLMTYIVQNYSELYLSRQHFTPQVVEIENPDDFDPLFIRINDEIKELGDTACTPWDVVLHEDVVATINDNLVGVAMGVMTPQEFAEVMDESLEQNHGT